MSENEKKIGVFGRIVKWLRELKSELKKVQWPTAKQTVNNTVIVLICCAVIALFIGVFDALANSVVEAIIKLF